MTRLVVESWLLVSTSRIYLNTVSTRFSWNRFFASLWKKEKTKTKFTTNWVFSVAPGYRIAKHQRWNFKTSSLVRGVLNSPLPLYFLKGERINTIPWSFYRCLRINIKKFSFHKIKFDRTGTLKHCKPRYMIWELHRWYVISQNFRFWSIQHSMFGHSKINKSIDSLKHVACIYHITTES